ncbi:unnamed protein product, partial [Prorocentrum cordatum]
GKKAGEKDHFASWVIGGVFNTVSFMWLRRSGGLCAPAAFLGWRAWRVLGLGSALKSAHDTILFAGEEMWESGELGTLVTAVGCVLAGAYALRWVFGGGRRFWSGDSDSESEASDAEFVTGTQVPDSDDEPDARHLYAELAMGQSAHQ